MTRKRRRAQGTQEPLKGPQAGRLELNRRHKAINESGVLRSLNGTAWAVFSYALAHADFETCEVYLGAKTVADRVLGGSKNRTAAKRGIAKLVTAGVLEIVTEASYRKATIYRFVVQGGDTYRCAPSSSGRGHNYVCPQGTHIGVPPGDTPICVPKHSKNVLRTFLDEEPGDRTAGTAAPQPVATSGQCREERLRKLRIVPKKPR
jgi:hypothetical protein